jgi:integrase
MPRPKFQRGHVELTGKREKKWTGHYYTYVSGEDGAVTRRHHKVIVGTRAEIRTKHEAQQRLQQLIERETSQSSQPGRVRSDATVGWFAAEVFVPLRRPHWKKAVTASCNLSVLERHILPVLGPYRIEDVTPVMIQSMLDEKADSRVPIFRNGRPSGDLADRTFSRSLVKRIYILTKALFAEAVDQDVILKNPARRCTVPPQCPKPRRPALTEQQVAALLGVLGQRDHLIVRLLSLCALRAGELFALRWRDWDDTAAVLFIREQISGDLKTESSAAPVVLTAALNDEMHEWYGNSKDTNHALDAFIFPSEAGTPIAPGNYLKRVLKPAAKNLGINHVTIHMFRRTYPTIGQHGGSVKDLQAQLRHASPDMTASVYMQSIGPSVRAAAEFVERKIVEAAAQAANDEDPKQGSV